MAPTLLHGTIYATIIEADKLQGRFSLDYLCGKVYIVLISFINTEKFSCKI